MQNFQKNQQLPPLFNCLNTEACIVVCVSLIFYQVVHCRQLTVALEEFATVTHPQELIDSLESNYFLNRIRKEF